jgi:hypothetical protein
MPQNHTSATTSARAAAPTFTCLIFVQEYIRAIELYQDALAISPMYPDSWFKLGCAAMREEKWEISVQAFLRVVQQVRAFPFAWLPCETPCVSSIPIFP